VGWFAAVFHPLGERMKSFWGNVSGFKPPSTIQWGWGDFFTFLLFLLFFFAVLKLFTFTALPVALLFPAGNALGLSILTQKDEPYAYTYIESEAKAE